MVPARNRIATRRACSISCDETYAANPYPYNYDIGFYSHFATSGPPPGNGYQHTGLVRDSNDNVWKLFSNVAEPLFGVVVFDANTVYDAFKSGPITSTGSVYTPGEATIVFFALFVGSFNFMQLLPNIIAILEGLKAAKRLYAIIDK